MSMFPKRTPTSTSTVPLQPIAPHSPDVAIESGDQKNVPGQMPDCWRVDYHVRAKPAFVWFWRLEALCFQFLCLIAFGRIELDTVWLDASDEALFKDMREQTKNQVNNTNIMSGLLLATTAVYLTTDTPRQDILAFNDPAPYALLLFAFGTAMGSFLGGCALQLVAGRCTPGFLMSLMSSRHRLMVTLLLIGYPLFSVVAACNICSIGLLIACLSSPHRYVWAGAIFLAALCWLLFLVFVWLAIPTKVRTRQSIQMTPNSSPTFDLERGVA